MYNDLKKELEQKKIDKLKKIEEEKFRKKRKKFAIFSLKFIYR